jgi:RHS repeat-associated protein
MNIERNTFYWNAQQFAPYVGQDPGSFVWTNLATSRIRHWLATSETPNYDGPYNHWGSLASEQAPSPDGGTTQGQITWYDYAGKPSGVNYEQGPQIQPSVIAQAMPDGTTWYQYYLRNTNGLPTQKIEQWVSGGAPLFRTNTWTYAANNIDMIQHIGPLGEAVESNWFNANHEVVTNYDALGQMTTYTYDPSTFQMTSVTRPTGLDTTNLYFANHRLEETIDLAINRTNSWTWASSGDVATFTDERSMTVTKFWDGLHRLTGTAYPDGTTTTNLYIQGGVPILDLTGTQDRLGNWTDYAYDSLRRKIGSTNANGISTTYAYCDCGALTGATRGANTSIDETTTYTYDSQPRLTQVEYPDGSSVTNTLDAVGRIIVVSDSMGSRTNTFDNLGRLIAVSNAFGQVQALAYDIEDNITNTIDANAVTIASSYDALHRLTSREYPDGGAEGFFYSARGLITSTNQLGFTNWITMDAASRKTAETNANSEITQYSYNPAGDLLTLTDPKTNVTTWHYDLYGRVTNKVDAASSIILTYQYDADNRLTNRWMTATGNTGYSYDPDGNLTNIAYPFSQKVSFKYDALDRRTNMVDFIGTTGWTWLAGGLLGSETGPNLSAFASDTITYTYTNRLRAALVLTQPAGAWTNLYTYDAAGRLSTLKSPAGTFTYDYKGPGLLYTNLAIPNTSYISNNFDNVARLTGTYLATNTGNVINSHGYTYNVGGQRTVQTRTDGSTVTYTYDPVGQLKTAHGSGGQSTENLGYVYDHGWNLATLTNAGVTSTFGVNSDNELTNALGHSCSSDGNGNLTVSRSTVGYTYDVENRLTTITNSTTYKTTFVYDGLGRMREQEEYTWLGGGWTLSGNATNYIYDGNLVIEERNAGVPYVTYTRGNDLSGSFQGTGGIGGMLARTTGYNSTSGAWSTHDYYHADGNGNITYLEASNQTLAASYRYDPYGDTIASSGTQAAANLYRFSSKQIHLDSGMYYYLYRFYDPGLQRLLNRDPVGELGGINLYSFSANDPVDRFDPFGMDPPVRNLPSPPGTGGAGAQFQPWVDNCLSYGLDCPGGQKQPDGGRGLNNAKKCKDLVAQISTKYHAVPSKPDGSCPGGYHNIAVFSDGTGGYHVQRQDSDGNWSEMGLNPTFAPRVCKRGDPGKDCGNLCVPNQR